MNIEYDIKVLCSLLKPLFDTIDGSGRVSITKVYEYIIKSIDVDNFEDNRIYDKYFGEFFVIPSNKVLIEYMTDFIVFLQNQ